jgi:hypothetical protein
MASDLDLPMEKSNKVEPGVYPAICKSITRKTGKFGDYLIWEFEIIDDEEFEGEKVNGMSNAKITDKSSTYRWAKVLLNLSDEVEVGETIKLSRCIGKECRISVDQKPDKNDSSKIYTNVEKVLAMKGKKKAETEEEEEPVAKKKKPVDDDDEEEAPAKKKKPVADDDDEIEDLDEEPAPKKKKAVEEDDDEEPAPKKKKPVDDDDDEEPAPKKKKVVDDDEDEAPKKKKKSSDDDEDEEVPF